MFLIQVYLRKGLVAYYGVCIVLKIITRALLYLLSHWK